jgi:uncharacterized protein YbgA (DUF1722 family)
LRPLYYMYGYLYRTGSTLQPDSYCEYVQYHTRYHGPIIAVHARYAYVFVSHNPVQYRYITVEIQPK